MKKLKLIASYVRLITTKNRSDLWLIFLCSFLDHTFMTSTQKRAGGGGLEICHMFSDSIVLKQ